MRDLTGVGFYTEVSTTQCTAMWQDRQSAESQEGKTAKYPERAALSVQQGAARGVQI